MGYVGMRRAYCSLCGVWFHRDLLAASNMVVATKYYLDHLSRPAYLLPIDKQDKFVFLSKYGPCLPPGVPLYKINQGDQPDSATESSSSAPPPGKTTLSTPPNALQYVQYVMEYIAHPRFISQYRSNADPHANKDTDAFTP